MPVNPLPQPSPLIFFFPFLGSCSKLCCDKNSAPFPVTYFFLPGTQCLPCSCGLSCVLRIHGSNFKMVFDFYGAVHSGKKQVLCILLLQKCCSALALRERQSRIAAAEVVFVLKFAQFQSAGFSRRFSHPTSK